MVPSQKPFCGITLPARRTIATAFSLGAMPDMHTYCRMR
jgi:hypothetical protein